MKKGFIAKCIFIFLLAFAPFLKVQAVGEFRMTINTDPFSTSDTTMTIPTNPNYSPNYTVDWGDGNVDVDIIGDTTHNYAIPGTYQVSISGDVSGLYFNNVSGLKEKVLSIDQWGTVHWLSMEQAFAGIPNLNINAADVPDLSGVTNMSYMFANIPAFSDVGAQMSTWNTTTIQNMEATFANSPGFNEDITSWNTANVTNMASTFLGATSFNRNIAGWDTSHVINMQQMFDGATAFDQPIGSWNTANVTNMYGMFASAVSFNQPLSFDTTSVTSTSHMFEAASSFNSDVSFNTANVTDMSYMFHEATSFDRDLAFNTQFVTDMSFMFADMSFNKNITSWDTSSVINMEQMFARNTAFDQDISLWNYESVTVLDGFLADANMSYQNYDSLLQAWDTQNTQDSLSTQVSQGIYCDSELYRSHLILTKGWSIIDVGTMSGCQSPRVVSVTSSDPNGNYKTGDVVHIQVVFNEPVNVGSGIPPTLTLETGTTDAIATLLSGSGTNTLTFAFTVLSSHTSTDLEYGSTHALAGVVLEDIANAAVKARTALPTLNSVNSLAGSKNITINQGVVASTQSASVAVQTGSWSLPTGFSGTMQRPYVIGGSCEHNTFTQMLRPGQRHAQVIEIKKLLNKDLGTALRLTNLFDESTRKAVIRFQEKYKKEILEPTRLKKGTGLWYNATIKKARELSCVI